MRIALCVLGALAVCCFALAGCSGDDEEPRASTQGHDAPRVSTDESDLLDVMRERVDDLGVAEPEIQRSGENQISVGLPDVGPDGSLLLSAELEPPAGGGDEDDHGAAILVKSRDEHELVVFAEVGGAHRVGVWLRGADRPDRFLGSLVLPAERGPVNHRFAVGPEPVGYKTVLVTREAGVDPDAPGPEIMSGPLEPVPTVAP